jgi:hypothetical protein
MDAVLTGDVLFTDIDDWVQRWHEAPDDPGVELHEALGMTFDEYALWVERPEALRAIITAHKTGAPLAQLAGSVHEFSLAARGLDEREREAVLSWLRDTGRIPT